MNGKDLAADVICSGNPPLWRTTFTVYNNNSQEIAIQARDEILNALNESPKLKEEFEKTFQSNKSFMLENQKLKAENDDLYEQLGKINYSYLMDQNKDLLSRIVQRDEENYQLKQIKERLEFLANEFDRLSDSDYKGRDVCEKLHLILGSASNGN